MIRYTATTQTYHIGKRKLRVSGQTETGHMFMRALTRPWTSHEHEVETPYSAPMQPFHGLKDINDDPVMIDEIIAELIKTGYVVHCHTYLNIVGEMLDLEKVKAKFPNWFGYAFLSSQFVPEIVNMDVAMLDQVGGIFLRFTIYKKKGFRAINYIHEGQAAPVKTRGTKRKIKTR